MIPKTTHVPQDVDKLTIQQLVIKIGEYATLLGAELDPSRLSLGRILTPQDEQQRKVTKAKYFKQFEELREMIAAKTQPETRKESDRDIPPDRRGGKENCPARSNRIGDIVAEVIDGKAIPPQQTRERPVSNANDNPIEHQIKQMLAWRHVIREAGKTEEAVARGCNFEFTHSSLNALSESDLPAFQQAYDAVQAAVFTLGLVTPHDKAMVLLRLVKRATDSQLLKVAGDQAKASQLRQMKKEDFRRTPLAATEALRTCLEEVLQVGRKEVRPRRPNVVTELFEQQEAARATTVEQEGEQAEANDDSEPAASPVEELSEEPAEADVAEGAAVETAEPEAPPVADPGEVEAKVRELQEATQWIVPKWLPPKLGLTAETMGQLDEKLRALVTGYVDRGQEIKRLKTILQRRPAVEQPAQNQPVPPVAPGPSRWARSKTWLTTRWARFRAWWQMHGRRVGAGVFLLLLAIIVVWAVWYENQAPTSPQLTADSDTTVEQPPATPAKDVATEPEAAPPLTDYERWREKYSADHQAFMKSVDGGK